MSPAHVLIIGGGLAGPCLAIALARHSIRSTILEVRPEPGNTGGALMLAPNALRVIDDIVGRELGQRIREAGFQLEHIGLYDDKGYRYGRVQMSLPPLEAAPSGEPSAEPDAGKATSADGAGARRKTARVPRAKLHRAILDECEKYKDLIEIRYGVNWTGIEELDDGVVVRVDGGADVKGDILVGADGIHSKVRAYILGPSTPTPKYNGIVGLGGSIARSSLKIPKSIELPAFVYSQFGMILFVPSDPSGETVGWAVQRSEPERDRQGWVTYQTSGEAAKNVKNDYQYTKEEPIRSLMDSLTDNTPLRLWAAYKIPDLPTWHTDRVCLIGDAAHAIPPTGGQGAAQAFEDAGYLSRLLVARFAKRSTAAGSESESDGRDESKINSDLFEFFEQTRKKRLEAVRLLTQTSGNSRRATGKWLDWVIKKWAMWGWFWWNAGWTDQVQTQVIGYDVTAESIEY